MASDRNQRREHNSDDAEHRFDLGAQDEACRHRRGGDEVGRVLAGDREPGEAAGELTGRHDQNRHQQRLEAPLPSSKLRHSSTAGGIR